MSVNLPAVSWFNIYLFGWLFGLLVLPFAMFWRLRIQYRISPACPEYYPNLEPGNCSP